MTDNQVALILSCKSAKEIWDSLTRRYEGDIIRRKIEAKNEVCRIKMHKDEHWKEYLLRGERLLQNARILEAEVTDQEFISVMIRGLPAKYNLVAMQFDVIENPTINDLHRLFKLHQERNGIYEKEENSKAYSVNWRKNKNTKGYERRDRQQKIICYVCNKPNHKAADCWHNKNRENKKEYGNRNEPRKFVPNTRFQKAKVAKDETENDETRPKEKTFSVKNSETNSKENFVLDSGCTSHMVNNISLMKEIENDDRTVTLADDSNIKSEAIGTVELTGMEEENFKLKNVLYVPRLSNNLISVSKLVQDKKRVIFDINGGHVIDEEGKELITARKIEEFYVIEPKDFGNNIDKVLKVGETSWILWHKRLGHINEGYMKIMKNNNLVHMFDTDAKGELGSCDTCLKAKFTRKPFKTVKEPQSNSILDLLHVDLIGPIKEKSIGGAKYIFTIVDDFSRKIFTEFLKEKSETIKVLKEFVENIENKMEKRIKAIRSDNGTENVNREMSEYCKQKGIEHQLTVIFSPSQNGTAERANRTLIEGTRALLIEAKLPTMFWAEAVNTWTYIKNRTPSRRNLNQTPEELFTKKKPTVVHLKIFGCQCYYWIPKQKREGKFSETSKVGIFTGYSKNRKAYRICDPETLETTEARDVKFLEDRRGSELLKLGQNKENVDYSLIEFENVIPEGDQTQVQNIQDDEDDSEERRNLSETNTSFDFEDPSEESELENSIEPRRNRNNVNYYESSLSDEESGDETITDPTYYPGDIILKAQHHQSIPENYEEAKLSPDREKWEEAMAKEIQSLRTHKVWDIVQLPTGIKPIRSKWVYAIKKNQGTQEKKYKARLVAVGCSQKYGVNYKETFSPVIKSDTLRAIIAYAAMENYEIHHFDVETAYLYGKLNENIYMEMPRGYEEKGEGKKLVCKLNQALYGLKQSGKVWFETMQEYLLKSGFKNFISDKCVFSYENGSSRLIIGLYVDDMIVINSDKIILDEVIEKLKNKFKIKEVTQENNVLGMEIERNEYQVVIKQEKYIDEILKRFNMQDSYAVSTPMDTNVKLDNFEGSKKCDKKKFQEILGSIMYLSTRTRPDITFAITALSRYNQEPRDLHLTAAKRIMRYLKGTKDQGLVYTKGTKKLEAYSDASWRCGKDNEKSVSGYAYMFGDNIISWSSKTQGKTALSTCDAELEAITGCVKKGLYLKVFLNELTNLNYKSVNIYNDNQASIFLCKNGVTREKSQHLIRNVNFVYEQLMAKEFELNFVSTEDNHSDIFTKALSNLKHNNCLKGLKII